MESHPEAFSRFYGDAIGTRQAGTTESVRICVWLPAMLDAFRLLGRQVGRHLNPAQPDDRKLSAGESLHPGVEWVGSHQPVPLARPIFSFEERCSCLVLFPAEPNLRLRMSTQVNYP